MIFQTTTVKAAPISYEAFKSADQSQKRLTSKEAVDYLRCALHVLPEMDQHQQRRVLEAFASALHQYETDAARKIARHSVVEPSYYWCE